MTHHPHHSPVDHHAWCGRKKLIFLCMAAWLTACEHLPKSVGTVDQKTVSTVAGATLGCAGGVLMAQLVGGDRLTACVVGAAAGGALGFERARRQELEEATASRQDIITTISPIANTKGVLVGEVKTQDISMKTDDGKDTKKIKAFESLTVELPIATKNRSEHLSAIEKLRKLAEKTADERGSAEIILAVRPEEAKVRKMNLTPEVITTAKGKQITFLRQPDPNVPRGVERVTVQAGPVRMNDKVG